MGIYIYLQIPWQGMHKKWRWWGKGRKSMEAVHSGTSGASENNSLSDPNICLHHNLQHHFSSASNLLSPTRHFHGFMAHPQVSNSSRFPPSHPLPHPHLPRSALRDHLRPPRPPPHRRPLRHLPPPARRHRPLRRHFLHGLRRIGWDQAAKLLRRWGTPSLDPLDRTAVCHFRGLGAVHCGRAGGVLLQAVSWGDAVVFNCHDLLLLLLWLLLELSFGVSSQQDHSWLCRWWLAQPQWSQQWQIGLVLLVTGGPQFCQFLQLSLLGQ